MSDTLDAQAAAETSVAPVPSSQEGYPAGMLARALAFLTVLISLLGSLHWYLGLRLIRDAGLAAPWSTVAWAVLWGGLALVLLGFVGGRVLGRRMALPLLWLGFGWMGAFFMLLSATAFSDLALWAARLAGLVGPSADALRAGAVVALVVPALGWGFRVAHAPEVKRVEVPVPGLHPSLDGFKLVQLSDVHIGETLGRDFAARLTREVNALAPDAVVITGDLVDGSVARLQDEVRPFRELRSTHGTFFVTGNHEYYSGATQWLELLSRLGMTVLQNRHRVLGQGPAQLVLGGVPDLQGAAYSPTHRPDVGAAFDGAPWGLPRVLLAHQPRMAKLAAGHGVALMLSGHTHGGQMFPFSAMVRLQQPVVSGLKELDGVLTYTSNGTGYWGPPFRIGPRGEITLVVLRAK